MFVRERGNSPDTHDGRHAGKDLGKDDGGHGFGVGTGVGSEADGINDGFGARDVSSGDAEGLRERAHEDVD